MNIIIRYFNDRKGKRQSHEIHLNDSSSSNPIIGKMEDLGCSYGEDLPEALKNHFDSAVALRDSLNSYIDDMRSGKFTLVGLHDLTPITHWYIDKNYLDESEKRSVDDAKTVFMMSTLDTDYLTHAILKIKDTTELEKIQGFIQSLIDIKSTFKEV